MLINYLNKLNDIEKIYYEFLHSETGIIFNEEKNYEYEKLLNDYSETLYKMKQFSKEIKEGEIPLNIGIFGTFSTGKSSIINSIIGESLLLDDISPSTALVSILKYGDEKKIKILYKNGENKEIGEKEFTSISNHLKDGENKESNKEKSEIDHVEIYYPSEILRDIRLIDTPGFSSISEEDDNTTKNWLAAVDILLWTFDINKGAIHKDELELLNNVHRKIESKRIIAILNKVDKKPHSEREKLYNSFKEDFDFHTLIPYSAKKVLANIIGEKENKMIMDDMVSKIMENETTKEERNLKLKNNEISFIIDNKIVHEKKLKRVKNDEYLASNIRLKRYLADLHKEKKALKEDEVNKMIKRTWDSQALKLWELKEKLSSYEKKVDEELKECNIVIQRFENDFKDNFNKLFRRVKEKLYRSIADAFKEYKEASEINKILNNMLSNEFFDENLKIIHKFIKMNDFEYDFEEDLNEVKFYLEQLIKASFNSIKGISKIYENVYELKAETLDLLVPDEQYKNILFEFYINIIRKMKKRVQEDLNQNIKEIRKFILEIEKICGVENKVYKEYKKTKERGETYDEVAATKEDYEESESINIFKKKEFIR